MVCLEVEITFALYFLLTRIDGLLDGSFPHPLILPRDLEPSTRMEQIIRIKQILHKDKCLI